MGVIALLFVPRPVGLALALPDLLVALHTRTPPSDADPVQRRPAAITSTPGGTHAANLAASLALRLRTRCVLGVGPEHARRELALGPCSTPRFLHPAGTAGGSTHSPPRLAPGNWLQPPSCRLPPPPITDKRVLPTLTLPSDMAAIDASPLSDENSILTESLRPAGPGSKPRDLCKGSEEMSAAITCTERCRGLLEMGGYLYRQSTYQNS